MKKLIILSFVFTIVFSGCSFQEEKVDKVGNVLRAVILRSKIEFPEEEPGKDFVWKTKDGDFLLSGRGYEYIDPGVSEAHLSWKVLTFFSRYGFKRISINTSAKKDSEIKVWAYTQDGVGCLTAEKPYEETEDNANDMLIDVRCGLIEEGVLQETIPDEDADKDVETLKNDL